MIPVTCGYVRVIKSHRDERNFETQLRELANIEGLPHAGDCGCQPCQVKRACLWKVLSLMARSAPGLFELVEA